MFRIGHNHVANRPRELRDPFRSRGQVVTNRLHDTAATLSDHSSRSRRRDSGCMVGRRRGNVSGHATVQWQKQL